MGILARLRLAKIRTMARPNSPDMPPKRTKKVRLGISIDYCNAPRILSSKAASAIIIPKPTRRPMFCRNTKQLLLSDLDDIEVNISGIYKVNK